MVWFLLNCILQLLKKSTGKRKSTGLYKRLAFIFVLLSWLDILQVEEMIESSTVRKSSPPGKREGERFSLCTLLHSNHQPPCYWSKNATTSAEALTYFLIKLKYSWHTMLYQPQVYNTVIPQVYTLCSAHHSKCSYHLFLYKVVNVLLTIFPVLYRTAFFNLSKLKYHIGQCRFKKASFLSS